MPATGHDIHIDVPLSNIALDYRPQGMIADMIAPVVPVPKQSNMYPIWSSADAFRTVDDIRGPGEEARRIYRAVSSSTYFAQNYALKMPLTMEDIENADDGYLMKLRQGRAQYILNKLYLGWEKRIALKCTSGSNVYSYSACASAWTGSGADPVADVLTKIDMINDMAGYRPNGIVMGGKAWRVFKKADAVTKYFWGTAGGNGSSRLVTRQMAAQLFEVDKFLVGEAYYNTTGEQTTQSLSALWGDHVFVYYAPAAPSTEDPSALYTFRWSRPGLPQLTVETHPWDAKRKTEEIEAGYYQDEKITSSALCALLTNVTSST